MSSADDIGRGDFEADFLWAAATASYQIEGAWDEDGKGPSIWDTYTHQLDANGEKRVNGDVACDSYHKYKEDVKLLRELGVNHYRFSISWPRILPDGRVGENDAGVNDAGVEYYQKLIDELLKANIKPFVTLYHWDLPQALQDKGGWQNRQIIDWFNDYADLCFRKFGDKVTTWITLNEPWVVAFLGHEKGPKQMAPNVKGEGDAVYEVAHNMILSHAKAYRTYNSKYNQAQKGQVGISLNSFWYEPKDENSAADRLAAERNLQFEFGMFAGPIVDGSYPQEMTSRISADRQQYFTEDEAQQVRGSTDFLGVNYYSARYVSQSDESYRGGDMMMPSSYMSDLGVDHEFDPKWERSNVEWLRVVPEGLTKLLAWINRTYDHPRVVVTENGYGDTTDTVNDQTRIDYIQRHINAIYAAIVESKCDVFGYTVWSLMDNLEWDDGYAYKFGLHKVNFADPARPRVKRDSARWYAKFLGASDKQSPRYDSEKPPSEHVGGSGPRNVSSYLFPICAVIVGIIVSIYITQATATTD
ncbi:cytosolic beta-glucosidase-like isoform X2 [Tubulanus polymorphus]|uniref:cytosolic beta-glucosidase-like isoform X2 n=1 Tax=Tubulanus polymorphus TaxID=672921 RepID=UPI003DA253EC